MAKPDSKADKTPLPPRAVTFARLLKLARPEAGTLALASVFLAVATAMNLAFPQGVRFIIDEALGGASREKIDQAAIVMAVVFLIQGFSIAFRYMLFSTAGERIVTRLRADLFEAVMGQEIAFFDKEKTGDLISRLSSDTGVLQNTVSLNISMGLRNLAAVVGGVALLLYTSPKLTVLMLAIVPPVALTAMFYGRRVRKLSKEVQDGLARATEVAEESLSGVRTVRSFAAEVKESTRYRDAVDESFRISKRRINLASMFVGVASFAAYFAASLVFWYGGRMVLTKELSVGELTSFLVYTTSVAFSLGSLSDLWADFQRAAGAAERVFELLERKPLIPLSGGKTLEHIQGHLRWEHVEFSYPTRPDVAVLKAFDLELKPGEVVALVGPSGAGKSTIASLLYRLYDPKGGRITVDGTALTELDPSWLRRQVGVVAQEPILFSTTIAENIRYGRPGATQAEIEAAARMANAESFVNAFPERYETLVGERGVQLSGGQKQRVAIARAILKDPRILILDEATSALDAESEFLVREALERLMKGRTTLVIAHRLSTVKGADRVVVLDDGKVAQVGTHDALVQQEGIYRRLVERQFAVA